MAGYQVAEIFSSINGEGTRSGQLALFIRMQGCNLSCSYCDTRWACGDGAPAGEHIEKCAEDSCTETSAFPGQADDTGSAEMTAQEILAVVRDSGIRNVTLTGGEPLLQDGIAELLRLLAEEQGIRVEIETNGSIPLASLLAGIEPDGRAHYIESGDDNSSKSGAAAEERNSRFNRPSINMDYKLPGSGMEEHMLPENFDVLTSDDTVKFVVSGQNDLQRSLELIAGYRLTERCRVYLSPVFGEIEPAEIAEFMKEHRMNDVTMQLQLHKIIWDPDLRGV